MHTRGFHHSGARRLHVLIPALLAPAFALGQAPTIGPQIRVDAAPENKQTSETSAVAVMADGCGDVPQAIYAAAAWMDFRAPDAYVHIRVALTSNAGATWNEYPGIIPPPDGRGSVEENDPMTAADPQTGVIWVGGFWKQSSSDVSGIFIARKAPCQATFDPSIDILPAPVNTADKPWMTLGFTPSGQKRLYISYIAGGSFGTGYVSWSNVDANGNTGPWTTTQIAPSGRTGYLPRAGPSGELYVAYYDYGNPSGTGKFHLLQRSLDGGQTFLSSPIKIVKRLDAWDHSYGSGTRIASTSGFQILPWGCLAVSPIDGRLYFVYYDTTSYDPSTLEYNVDMWFTWSSNQGTTWAEPKVISLDSSPVSDQWFHWLEVDSFNRLHLVFYSGRGISPPHPPNSDAEYPAHYHVVYAYSDDHGDTWVENFLTPTTPQNGPWVTPDLAPPAPGQRVGHYLGMAVAGTKCIPCYTSLQNGTIEKQDSDIFVNVITR